MFYNCTGIKISTTKVDEYQTEYRIPTKDTGVYENTSSTIADMFTGTGGTFVGTPEINVTYYTSNRTVPKLPSKTFFDLTSLNLGTGSYSITIRAKGSRLKDSVDCAVMNYVVGNNLITFTIEGETYQAEEGMTWGEWVESDYNTSGFKMLGLNVGKVSDYYYYIYGFSQYSPADGKIQDIDPIQANYAYTLKYVDGSGGGSND
jgi:hypothetical protein